MRCHDAQALPTRRRIHEVAAQAYVCQVHNLTFSCQAMQPWHAFVLPGQAGKAAGMSAQGDILSCRCLVQAGGAGALWQAAG